MEAQTKTNQFHFQKLTPSDEIDLGIYDDAIEYAFSKDDICNIALSGAYGAGKSSVIESYKKQHPERRFIHISLAHLTGAGQEEDVSVSDLEGKIINQLVHLIPVERIPQTNFAVKRKINTDNALKYTFFTMLFLLLGGYLCFYQDWCSMIAGLSDKALRDLFLFTMKKEFALLAVFVCAAMLGRICYEIIRWQMDRRILQKVNVKGNKVNIELFAAQEASYFDKYLNEVLYLFENVDAHAVVFEDMDRYNTKLVFEGLKEINTLLNRKRNLYAEEKREPLRFIYLLRDDMFMTKERTKFFDYIIPVVPVIDGSNSYDKFIELFRDGNIVDLFDDDFLRGLSLYIDDMRMLKNIVNEFVIYHGKFKKNYLISSGKESEKQDSTESDAELSDTEQNNNKLLAMIAYKNMFPRDFVELQVSRGYVYQLFHLKEEYAERAIKDIQEKIKDLERTEKECTEEECRSLDELDAIYYVERQPVSVNGKVANEFPTRIHYIRVIKENNYAVKKGRPTYGDYVWNDANIKEEFDALLSIPEYAARKEKIENKAEERQAQIQSQIAAYRKEQEQLRSAYLKDIITKENADEIFAKPQENRVGGAHKFLEIKLDPYFPLIQYLIRNGYIDETYPDYMTFFYANSISRQDKIFLRSITDEKAKEYDYRLQNPKEVIARMRPIDFGAKECWNYDLLDALLERKDSGEYRGYLDKFLGSLREWKPAEFVEGYMEHSDDEADFIREFNASWDGAVSWVIEEDFGIEVKYQYVGFTFIESTEGELIRYNRDRKLVKVINLGKYFLEYSNLDIELMSDRTRDDKIEKMIRKFKVLRVQFSSFSDDSIFKELLQAVYNENMYVLNWDMIAFFLEHMYHIAPSDEYDTKNLTLIFSQEQPLAEYVRDNLVQYIDMEIELVNQNWHQEDVETVLYVLNNKDVEDEKKMRYMHIWLGWLPEISAVEDVKFWKELMSFCLAYNQKNVFDYFFLSGNGMDETLTNYMNRYQEPLTFDISGLDEEYKDIKEARTRFFWQLIKNNGLENDKYRQLIQAFHMQGQRLRVKNLSLEKVRILIEEKVIEMSLINLVFLRINYPEAVNQFIESDIERYIDVMTEEKMSEDEVAHVLRMDIPDKEKIRLLKLETKPISVMHKNYSSKVVVYILQHLLDEDEKEQLFMWYPAGMPDVQAEIRRIAVDNIEEVINGRMRVEKVLLSDLLLGSRVSIDEKKILLANNLSDLWRDEAEVYLDRLDLREFHYMLEGKTQMLQGTEANISLLKAFQEKGWVSHYEVAMEDENIYAAYGCAEKEADIS